jgi:hypothetical protein
MQNGNYGSILKLWAFETLPGCISLAKTRARPLGYPVRFSAHSSQYEARRTRVIPPGLFALATSGG